MITIRKSDRRRYVVKDERELPEEEQTAFFLRPLSLDDRLKIQDSVADVHRPMDENAKMNFHTGKSMLRTLKLGIADVENLKDSDGNVVPFGFSNVGRKAGESTQKQATNEFLEQIPMKYLREIAEAINEDNKMGEEDRKNSSSELE